MFFMFHFNQQEQQRINWPSTEKKLLNKGFDATCVKQKSQKIVYIESKKKCADTIDKAELFSLNSAFFVECLCNQWNSQINLILINWITDCVKFASFPIYLCYFVFEISVLSVIVKFLFNFFFVLNFVLCVIDFCIRRHSSVHSTYI